MLSTSSMTKSLNIIARTNGVGLDRDVDLIRSVASEAGYEVTVSHSRAISPLRRWFPGKKKFTANIFLERVFPRWLGTAEMNILVPNQERFPHRHVPILKDIDHIFCKSQHAIEIFGDVHPSCHFTGFTSLSMNDPAIPRRQLGILHLAGKSTLKGTETILDLWQKHPDWPPLTLVQAEANAPAHVPENVNLITRYLEDDEITKLYNEHPIHLCPSRSEGWGHYLVEAMSCGAAVISTDGPPMNELVRPDRGFLVKVSHTEPRHLGTNFFVDPDALERTIEIALATPPEKLALLGEVGRDWVKENHETFKTRLIQSLASVLR